MLKTILEAKTPMMNTQMNRSTFLRYCALLLSAAGTGVAQAHSTLSKIADVPDSKTSDVAGSNARRTHIKQQVHRHNGKVSDRIPNILLATQDDKPLRFYDDLVRNKTVIVDFMYATCDDRCPMKTFNLVDVHRRLGGRVGHDIFMLSISLEGKRDTPEMLRQYIKRYGGPKTGWLYLTGDYHDVEALRYSLGVYDLDPIIDADKESHDGIVTFGNDSTNRWSALPAMMDSRGIARTVSRITRDTARIG